jgi:hypothetical protein
MTRPWLDAPGLTLGARIHSTSGNVISSPAVSVVWRDGDAFVARWRNVVGVRWIGVPGVRQLEALARAHDAASEGGERVVLFNDVFRLDGSTRVEPHVHRAMLALIARGRGHTSAVAHVIEVPGPAGPAVRAFLTALEALSGQGSTRTATFARPELAARWLATFEPGTTGAQLEAAWQAMAQADARRAA